MDDYEDLVKDCKEVKKTKSGHFQTYGKFYILTYKKHLNKEVYIKWFKDLLREKKGVRVRFIRLAHEMGDTSHDYKHTHVVFELEEAVRIQSERFFDFERNEKKIHPNIRKIFTLVHLQNAKRYLSKEDEDNADLKDVGKHWVEKMKACGTAEEALKECTMRPSEACGTLAVWDMLSKVKTVEVFKVGGYKHWQRQLYSLFRKRTTEATAIRKEIEDMGDPDWEDGNEETEMDRAYARYAEYTRKITVIYDPKGNSGKTYFQLAYTGRHSKDAITLQGLASSRDISTILMEAMNRGWSGDTAFINLTRQCVDHKIYNSLETIRDGVATTQKWSGKTIRFHTTNVAVFTNWMPDLSKCSADRWEIYRIAGKTSPLIEVSLEKAREIYRGEKDEEASTD